MIFIAGLVVTVGALAGAGAFGWSRSNEIAELPCLGCLGLNPAPKGLDDFQFDTVLDRPHPDYIVNELNTSVIFLHFRIDICPACDEIEPTIFDIEEEYTQVSFHHMNLEHDYDENNLSLNTKELRKLYNTYDLKLEETKRAGGVPMMVIMTLFEDDGVAKPYFNTIYGSAYTRGDITKMLDSAMELHDEYAPE